MFQSRLLQTMPGYTITDIMLWRSNYIHIRLLYVNTPSSPPIPKFSSILAILSDDNAALFYLMAFRLFEQSRHLKQMCHYSPLHLHHQARD